MLIPHARRSVGARGYDRSRPLSAISAWATALLSRHGRLRYYLAMGGGATIEFQRAWRLRYYLGMGVALPISNLGERWRLRFYLGIGGSATISGGGIISAWGLMGGYATI